MQKCSHTTIKPVFYVVDSVPHGGLYSGFSDGGLSISGTFNPDEDDAEEIIAEY